MKKNWTLHLVAHKGRVPRGLATYSLGISRDGGDGLQGGTTPTVHYPSWQHLSLALAAVGIAAPQITDLKVKLEEEFACDIRGVCLDEEDIQRLGFSAQQVPPDAS